jgi:centromere protein C
MAPRGSSIGLSSPARAASHPVVARRLDFEQDESSLQETPALSGSGQRRGKRASVYDIPEDDSPVPESSAVLEESMVQEEITINDDSVAIDAIAEESIAQIGDDTLGGAEAVEDLVDMEETGLTPEPVKEPVKRGRKRKSEVLEAPHEENSSSSKAPKRGPASAQESEAKKKGRKPATAPAASSRRSKRVSDMVEQDSSVMDASVDMAVDAPEEVEEAHVPIKRRGRPARPKPEAEKEHAVPAKAIKTSAAKAKSGEGFKKPQKPAAKQKPGTKSKAGGKLSSETPETNGDSTGKLVDAYGAPLSKKDIEHMSTTSTTSRYGRGRHLSVFRELEPEAVARVGRTGRHRVEPMDFWKNDRIAYDAYGGMRAIVKNQVIEPERKTYKSSAKGRGRKQLTMVEEEEIELDPWEEEEGVLLGNYRDYDAVSDVISPDIIEGGKWSAIVRSQIITTNTFTDLAWAQKGIKPVDVADGSFQFVKLGSAGNPAASFFAWGLIELRADQMKRSKNSRMMHMVFNVQSGTVEVKVHENEFIVHKGGIWQVPRGKSHHVSLSSVLRFLPLAALPCVLRSCVKVATVLPKPAPRSALSDERHCILQVIAPHHTSRNARSRPARNVAPPSPRASELSPRRLPQPNCSAACRACCVTFASHGGYSAGRTNHIDLLLRWSHVVARDGAVDWCSFSNHF